MEALQVEPAASAASSYGMGPYGPELRAFQPSNDPALSAGQAQVANQSGTGLPMIGPLAKGGKGVTPLPMASPVDLDQNDNRYWTYTLARGLATAFGGEAAGKQADSIWELYRKQGATQHIGKAVNDVQTLMQAGDFTRARQVLFGAMQNASIYSQESLRFLVPMYEQLQAGEKAYKQNQAAIDHINLMARMNPGNPQLQQMAEYMRMKQMSGEFNWMTPADLMQMAGTSKYEHMQTSGGGFGTWNPYNAQGTYQDRAVTQFKKDLTAPEQQALRTKYPNVPEETYKNLVNNLPALPPQVQEHVRRMQSEVQGGAGAIQQTQTVPLETLKRLDQEGLTLKEFIDAGGDFTLAQQRKASGASAALGQKSPLASAFPLPVLKEAFYASEASGESAESPAGALGRGQIMPATAKPYIDQLMGAPQAIATVKQALLDPKVNAKVVDMHLRDLMQKHPNWSLESLAAAYFSGEGNINADGSIKNPNLRALKDSKAYGPTVAEYAAGFVQHVQRLNGQGGRVGSEPASQAQSVQPGKRKTLVELEAEENALKAGATRQAERDTELKNPPGNPAESLQVDNATRQIVSGRAQNDPGTTYLDKAKGEEYTKLAQAHELVSSFEGAYREVVATRGINGLVNRVKQGINMVLPGADPQYQKFQNAYNAVHSALENIDGAGKSTLAGSFRKSVAGMGAGEATIKNGMQQIRQQLIDRQMGYLRNTGAGSGVSRPETPGATAPQGNPGDTASRGYTEVDWIRK